MPSAGDPVVALTWASAFLLGISVGRWLRQWRARRSDELRGAVPSSAQLIAAWRAVESLELEEGKLFDDPLAAVLAGQTQFAKALAAAQVGAPCIGRTPLRPL